VPVVEDVIVDVEVDVVVVDVEVDVSELIQLI
jgi:hypothetical protein